MNLDQLLDAAEPIVRQAARQVEQRFHGYVDMDDLCQELRLWCFEHEAKLSEWLDSDDPKDVKHGSKKLMISLSREAERTARKERAVMLGYKPEDEWFANKGVLQELLPVVISGGYDGYEVTPKELVQGGRSDPAEGNGRLALLSDVKAAWEAHPSPLLERIYGSDTPVSRQELADEYGISTVTLSKRENHALDMMIRFLGGATPYG